MTMMPPRQIVLASAGSGKTFWISSRMIELLAYGVPPEEVLGATFTRKAAGEILDRILKRLAEGASSLPGARKLSQEVFAENPRMLGVDQWARTLETLIRNLHRVNIGTLDSFFMKSATAFGGELGLPPGWRIMDEATGVKMASEGLSEVLAKADQARMVELVRLISRGNVHRSIHRSLAGMMDQMLEIEEQLDPDVPDPWSAFALLPQSPPVPTRADREALASELRALELPLTKTGTVQSKWQNAIEKICRLLDVADWDEITKETLCNGVLTQNPVYGGAVPSDIEFTVQKVLSAARAALRPRLAGQMQALKEVTRGYAEVFRRHQAERGLFGFRDVTRLIGEDDGVGGRLDFFYRLDSRTRHALLDEFQDTSMSQWEALRPIVGEVLSDIERGAVIVADPKQSIYGWRGAEPDVVHAVAAHYSLEQRVLAKSWRSSPVVLDFVNFIFGGVAANPVLATSPNHIATAASWSRDFREHTAEHESLPGYVRVEVGPADETRSSKRPNLLGHAARRIAELHAASPNATIGVLTRTNQAVARLFLELRALGVPVSQEGGNPLTDSAPCEAILALLRLVDHPGDSISRYHVAETPIGKVLGYTDFADEAGAAKLAGQIRGGLVSDGYGPTISRIATLLAPFSEPREARRLSQITELAYRYDEVATLRTMDFIRLVETQRVEDRATAQVRVMTVHQAKGLEFDIVVLPQLDSTLFGSPRYSPAAAYREDPGGRITGVFPNTAAGVRALFPELEPAYHQREAGILRDGLSALYVSLTRARHALHIVIAPDGESKISSMKSPAKLLRHALRAGEPLELISEGMVLHESGDPGWYAGSELAQKAPPEPVEQVSVHLELAEGTGVFRRQTPSSLHGDSKVDVRELLRIDNSTALLRGSLVHAWFEQIEWLDEAAPGEAELIGVAREVAPLAEETKLREMLREFFSWLSSRPVREILSRGRYAGEVVVERELPFMHRSGDVLMEGAIDRLVISYREGRAVAAEIIDFKSDRTESGSASVASLARRYAPQLRAYREAVSAMYRIPAEACSATLVFLEAGRLVAVGVEEPEAEAELDRGAAADTGAERGEQTETRASVLRVELDAEDGGKPESAQGANRQADQGAEPFGGPGAESFWEPRAAEPFGGLRAESFAGAEAEQGTEADAELFADARAELFTEAEAELFADAEAEPSPDARAELFTEAEAELFGAADAEPFAEAEAEQGRDAAAGENPSGAASGEHRAEVADPVPAEAEADREVADGTLLEARNPSVGAAAAATPSTVEGPLQNEGEVSAPVSSESSEGGSQESAASNVELPAPAALAPAAAPKKRKADPLQGSLF